MARYTKPKRTFTLLCFLEYNNLSKIGITKNKRCKRLSNKILQFRCLLQTRFYTKLRRKDTQNLKTLQIFLDFLCK